MITKTVKPVLTKDAVGASREQTLIETPKVIGTTIEYRFLGLLFFRKSIVTPAAYNIEHYEFITSF